jgi:hypothetical protein
MKPPFLIIAGCLILSFFNSCNKDLPPATTTGANTFGCLINGQIFSPKISSLTGLRPINCGLSSLNDTLIFSVYGTREYETGNVLTIGFEFIGVNPQQGDTYNLRSIKYGEGGGFYKSLAFSGNEYFTTSDTTTTGQLTLTRFDLTNRIASGNFSFNVIDSTTSDTIKITEGRFDSQFTY